MCSCGGLLRKLTCKKGRLFLKNGDSDFGIITGNLSTVDFF
jgi:hypothetical protein